MEPVLLPVLRIRSSQYLPSRTSNVQNPTLIVYICHPCALLTSRYKICVRTAQRLGYNTSPKDIDHYLVLTGRKLRSFDAPKQSVSKRLLYNYVGTLLSFRFRASRNLFPPPIASRTMPPQRGVWFQGSKVIISWRRFHFSFHYSINISYLRARNNQNVVSYDICSNHDHSALLRYLPCNKRYQWFG